MRVRGQCYEKTRALDARGMLEPLMLEPLMLEPLMLEPAQCVSGGRKREEGRSGGRGGGADRHPQVTQISGNKHTPLQRRPSPIPRTPPTVVCARRPLAL